MFIHTLPVKIHYGGEKLGKNRGRGGRILTCNEFDLTFWVLSHRAKFHQNRLRIAAVGEATDGQTDRRK